MLNFCLKKLPKRQYKYHELHYTYSSDEHYLPLKTQNESGFSFSFLREKISETYRHDSYDTLYDDSWKNCTAYGVFTNESEKIAGYLEFSRENWNDRLRITNLLVLEEFRGHGIGSFLINKAKSVAESENRRIMVLETQSCNVPAIDFYLKHGFVFAGTNLYFYSNCDIAEDEVMIEMAYLY